jgi:LmbE family N-acetylglucosaminyl deacetylase
MRWEPQTLASEWLHPIHFGNASPAARNWSAGLALTAAAVVIFDAPPPLRPLAVLVFLGFGPGLSLIGLFGISDLTQRLVLSIGVSLALDTIVAGLSLYAGLWSPLGVLLILIAITLVGAGLQLRIVTEAPGGTVPAPMPYGANMDGVKLETPPMGAAMAAPIVNVSAAEAGIAIAGQSPTVPGTTNVNVGSIAHVFLSPHLDDVVLSCAGQILHFVHHGAPVTVMTVFAGDPPPGKLAPHAEWFHVICGLNTDPVGVRRREDMQAVKTLGAEPVHLPLPDHMYRPELVGTSTSRPLVAARGLSGSHEEYLISEIVAKLHAIAGYIIIGSVHVPLGIGRHTDHVIVRTAAETFIQGSTPAQRPQIVYYEECPDAARNMDPTWHYDLVAGLEPEIHTLCDEDWQCKLQAIRAYQSQMAVLGGSGEELEDELAEYAREVGDGQYAERLWRPDSRG